MDVNGFLGTGLYSISEASHLTRVNASTLRRWLEGYTFTYKGEKHSSPPRWRRQVHGKGTTLGFLDLIEARIIGRFRELGVRWSTLHAASAAAQKSFQIRHPFATLRLRTDGRAIFYEIATETSDKALAEIVHNQRVFDPIMRPLMIEVEFEKDLARRWWPLGKKREVVLDPNRAFGRPIVNSAAIPTAVLARAVKAEGSVERVASWYELSERAVQDAVDFERKLAA